MSNGDDPPKPVRTLLGMEGPGDDPDEPPHVVIPPGGETTLPMGSSSLRESLNQVLAEGPAAAAARLQAARAGLDPASTAPMGSAAIANAAAAAEPRKPISFTAKGTPPSTHELAAAIAKAAATHAASQPAPPPDPSTRKPTTPGVPSPVVSRTPTPGASPFAPARPAHLDATALDMQPPSLEARARPPTGPNPAAFAPQAPHRAPAGTDPTALDPARARPPTNPNPHAVITAQGYAPDRARPPTGPNPALDPGAFAAKPGSNPNAVAYAAGSAIDPASHDPARPRPPTGPVVTKHNPTMVASPESLGPARPSADSVAAGTLRDTSIDNYAIQGEIARGGMGRILRAVDVRMQRPVALKVLVGNSADFKARFERETLITARLQHPAIVPVYDAGRWPTGELFYTMKYVAGRPLESVIHSMGGMRERLALVPHLIAVADALAYAHAHRIVHRDLKPANILIGDFGETIVIDWGLAKDLSTNEVAEPAGPFRSAPVGHMGATVAGSVMGTPAYMPLEQGRGLQVDERADVYAIGAVLYHLLAKRPPYDGPDGMTILQVLLKEPPPPLTELAPDVPRELATIVAKAMAREPEGRYRTANELAADLRRYQNGQMVGVHRYTSRELFARWARKHKGALAVASVALLALIAVGVLAISRIVAANREAQHEAAVAQQQSEAAQVARQRAEASEARAKQSEVTAADERDRQRFARERRVEFDHFAHTQRVPQCASCHPTDPKTFTALAGHPGHAECQGACHEHDASTMEGISNDPKCAFCHLDRVATTKDHVSLRACDDASLRAIKAVGGKPGPCFRHDAKAHRFADDGKPLECTTCHAVLADKTKWGTKSYRSLQDLDTNTIIGQGAGGGVDAMHKACSTGCHAHEAETGQTPGQPSCAKCHPKRTAF